MIDLGRRPEQASPRRRSSGTNRAHPEGQAKQTGDSGGIGACPVVNTDDSGNETTTYVPHGTKLAGLTCKAGTWIYAEAVKAPATLGGRLTTATSR